MYMPPKKGLETLQSTEKGSRGRLYQVFMYIEMLSLIVCSFYVEKGGHLFFLFAQDRVKGNRVKLQWRRFQFNIGFVGEYM